MGKSSLVKAVHARVAAIGPALRIIAVQREDLPSIGRLLGFLRGASERFVLFCDDLSFAQDDEHYKSLKGVLDGGPADRAGLRMGHRIVSVDGEPFRPIESFAGKADRPVSIVVQTHPAEERGVRVTVTPERISPAGLYREAMMASVRLIERGGKTVGYIHVWSYAGEQYHQLLRSAVIGGPLSGADALIVDLRDGWGGAQAKYPNLFNQGVPPMPMVGPGSRRRPPDARR